MAKKTDTKIVSSPPTQSATLQAAGQMAVLPTTGQGEFLLYQTEELQEAATCKPYLQVRQERGRQVSRSLKHYNLEVALASEHPLVMPNAVQEPMPVYGPGGYVLGRASDYNRDMALDAVQLLAFLQATQPEAVDTLELAADGIKRTQFLRRLRGEITKRGVVDCLRRGVSHGPVHVDLYPAGHERPAAA